MLTQDRIIEEEQIERWKLSKKKKQKKTKQLPKNHVCEKT